jgi:hypothetical protein
MLMNLVKRIVRVIIHIELMYIAFVPFDWTRELSPVCFCSVHNSMSFCVPELLFCVYITPRYTTLECNDHVVMVRVSMKNAKRFTLKNYKDFPPFNSTFIFRTICYK